MSLFDLIITDVDGTLLDTHLHLPETVIQAVRRAQKAGLLVTIASGRSQCSLAGLLEALDIAIPHNGSCGAYLADRDGAILKHTPSPKKHRPWSCALLMPNTMSGALFTRLLIG